MRNTIFYSGVYVDLKLIENVLTVSSSSTLNIQFYKLIYFLKNILKSYSLNFCNP